MGASILYVMAFHNICIWPKSLKLVEMFVNRGNVGVDVFLLISGIGLYYSLSRADHTDSIGRRIGSFYWKRIVRLFVPYLFLAMPYYLWITNGEGAGKFLLYFTQLAFPLEGLATSWYIPTTFVFYILFPLIFFLQNKKITVGRYEVERNTITLLMCICVLFLCRAMDHYIPDIYDNFEIGLTRLVVFIIGAGLGKEVMEKKEMSYTAVAAGLAYIFILIYVFFVDADLTALWVRMLYAPLGVSFAIVFAFVFYKLDGCSRIRNIFRFFGDRSLELYLSHVFIRRVWVFYMGEAAFDRWDAIAYSCILIISIVISTILHPIVQIISKKLLELYPPRKKADEV